MKIIYLILALFAVALVALLGLRLLDWRAEQEEWARLKGFQPDNPLPYDPEMVAELPEPVQRYFNFAIAPGTPCIPWLKSIWVASSVSVLRTRQTTRPWKRIKSSLHLMVLYGDWICQAGYQSPVLILETGPGSVFLACFLWLGWAAMRITPDPPTGGA